MQPLRHISLKDPRSINKVVRKYAKRKSKHECKRLVIAIGVDDKGEVICIKSNAPPNIYTTRINTKVSCLQVKDRANRKIGLHAEERVIEKCNRNISKIFIFQIIEDIYGNLIAVPIDPCDKCKKLANKYEIEILPLKLKKSRICNKREKKLWNQQ